MKKKILIGVGVIVIAIIILMATGVLKFSASVSPSQTTSNAEVEESILPEGWVKYTSGEFGYSLAYPDGWNISENNGEGSRDVLITAPQGKAFVRIAGFQDASVNSVTAVEASMAAYKASLESKSDEQLNEFKSEMKSGIGYFGAAGKMDVGGIIYQFLERGMLATNGRVLIMRGAVNTSETDLTQEEFDSHIATVKQIMGGFAIQ